MYGASQTLTQQRSKSIARISPQAILLN